MGCMSILIVIVAVIVGLAAGGGLAAVLVRQQRETSGELLEQLLTTNQAVFGAERDRSTAELDGKKSLIDQQLEAMAGRLDEVSDLVQRARGRPRPEVRPAQPAAVAAERRALRPACTRPRASARCSRARRRAAGGGSAWPRTSCASPTSSRTSNYRKQRAAVGGHGIPDFTFFLPNDLSCTWT